MPFPNQTMNLARLLRAFSAALDLGSPGTTAHHQRVTLIALELGRALGLEDDAREHLFYASIIHDIGVSTTRERMAILGPDSASPHHAVVGANRLEASRLLAPYAHTVRYHHQRWDGAVPGELGGDEIPLLARIVHLADRTAVLITNDAPVLRQTETLIRTIRRRSGGEFDPALVECLSEVLLKEELLLDSTSGFMCERIDEEAPRRNIEVSVDDLVGVSQVFAEVIDGKTPYTRRHSQNVARVAGRLSAMLGFSRREVRLMEVAGLLHDLGKLSVDDGILDKRAPLDPDEQLTMKQHPYYTYRILRMVDGLEMVSEWAALHHERMNGKGYPFHVDGDSLSLGSRIMAVADVVSALSEDRPYRQALSDDDITTLMQRLATQGELDPTVVSPLLRSLSHVRSVANKEV